MKTSHLAKFESYVANGAHRANANMGIYSPVIRPIIKRHPIGAFFIANAYIVCILPQKG